MLQAIEFPTILSDNIRIEIPVHLQDQLKANQAVRVIILFDSEDEKILENS